tara:strand:+ start:1112 stop:1426 length:315 start_codon:yes stop_codon:yes gene_type:complete
MSRSSKVVRGAKFQKRPSASYYYRELGKPRGYKISYRPRKGGKYILHSLELRKNGSPYWKSLEKLPKRTKKKSRGKRRYSIKKTFRQKRQTRQTKRQIKRQRGG